MAFTEYPSQLATTESLLISSLNISMNSKQNKTSNGWPELNLTTESWILILCLVVLLWILISFCLAYFLGPDFVTCYLCEKQIPRSYWLSGEHRTDCAKENEAFLDKLPCPIKSARCPVCYRPLKLWPKSLGPPEFNCSSKRLCQELDQDQRMKKPWKNDGTNRLNCYNCDIDMCLGCATIQSNAGMFSRRGSLAISRNGWVV